MLIAPIFHNNYLTKSKQSDIQDNEFSERESQNKTDNEAPSTTTSTRYNIFKTAINRGTELIRNTFLGFSNDEPSSSTSISTTNTNVKALTNTSSIIYTQKYERDSDLKNESCSSNDSYCSSPDSIRTELMFFKPVTREAQTLTSSKIVRIPSIRSTSSTSTIQSPCPSPFFIPITSQRQSAFSFVFQLNDDPVNPKTVSTKRKKTDQQNVLLPKRQKMETRQKIIKNEKEDKTDDARQTRSMIKKSNKEVLPLSNTKEFKTPKFSASSTTVERRITRSMKVLKKK